MSLFVSFWAVLERRDTGASAQLLQLFAFCCPSQSRAFLFLQERTVRSISYSMLHLHPQDYLLYLIFFSPLLLQFTFIFKGALTNPNGQICWRFQNFYANFRESFVEWPIKSVVLDSVFKVIYDNGNDSSFLINR